MANGPMLRMNELDKVEKEVVSCLQNTGKALEEVGKDNLFGVVNSCMRSRPIGMLYVSQLVS